MKAKYYFVHTLCVDIFNTVLSALGFKYIMSHAHYNKITSDYDYTFLIILDDYVSLPFLYSKIQKCIEENEFNCAFYGLKGVSRKDIYYYAPFFGFDDLSNVRFD